MPPPPRNYWLRKNFKFFAIALFYMIATYGCKPTPPGSTNLASVQLTLTGFIGDCKVDNGSTNIDVGYSVSVETRQGPNSFDNAIRLDTYKGNSPTTANKDSYTTTIKVPKDQPYWIDIIIDAKDCSLCAKGGCNPYNWNGYQMNNIPPYWIYRTYNTSVPPTGSIIITPLWAIRNPNGSRNCFCQIKL